MIRFSKHVGRDSIGGAETSYLMYVGNRFVFALHRKWTHFATAWLFEFTRDRRSK